MNRFAPCLTAALCLAACAAPQKPAAAEAPAPAGAPAPAATGAAIPAWGVDLSGLDRTVKPGDDFFRFAGGAWLKATQIPGDHPRFGVFDKLADESEAQVRAIIDGVAKSGGAPGSIEQKIADDYTAFLDTAAIEARGLKPIGPVLAEIAAATTHEDLARLVSRPDVPLSGPVNLGITVDQKNPDRYVLVVSQGGLGMPDRDYYLKDDERSKEVRAKYVAHLGRMLALAGHAEAAKEAQEIYDLELQIAKIHWDRARSRERELTYNMRTKSELEKFAPDFPWGLSLETAGVGSQGELVLRQLDAIPQLAALFRRTPVSVWKAKLTYSLLVGAASVLPKAFDDEAFEFRGRVLGGQPEQRERWKRGVVEVNGALGEAVGQLYVARHFSPQAKAKMLALVENMRAAYGARIESLGWMSPETKQVAREKLAAFRPKIGYPDKWRDYARLEIIKGDAVGNARRALQFNWDRQVTRLGKPTDREEWGMTPQTVNAYYNATFNEIVFPAAILQPPFFDPEADPAVNYGGIGGVIGHEMGHGFDDQGAKSDAHGVLRTWWNEKDVAAFKSLTDRLADQYAGYEPLPGAKLNGRLELGENIGDNGGLQVAYEAYRLSLAGKPAPLQLDGFSGDQRFFLGWAQVWRVLYREAAMRSQIITDPHAPGEFRVNGTVRNMDAWYAAFGARPGDKLYAPPAQRVKIW